MYKKINKIAVVIMIFFFILNVFLAVFVMAKSAKAAESCTTCPPKGKIRVQVPIPGLSQMCTYETISLKSGKAKPITKACYYVDSLPQFVKKVYTFSVGVIAIIAVLMIMIGGLRWIFAAGRAGQITEAKSTIYSAIIGLVLALFSYVILSAINPRLTNLSLPGVTDIATIVQGADWCSQLTGDIADMQLSETGKAGDSHIDADEGKCEKEYFYGTESGGNFVNLGKEQKCWGNVCDDPDENVCGFYTGFSTPSCFKAKDFCNEQPKGHEELCQAVDETLKSSQKKGLACVYSDRYSSKDQCKIGNRLVCGGANEEQVNCDAPGSLNVCHGRLDDGSIVTAFGGNKFINPFGLDIEKYYQCKNTDETAAKIDASMIDQEEHYICCRNTATGGFSQELDNDCYDDIKTCNNYLNKYECELNRCGIGLSGKCRWTGAGTGCMEVSPGFGP